MQSPKRDFKSVQELMEYGKIHGTRAYTPTEILLRVQKSNNSCYKELQQLLKRKMVKKIIIKEENVRLYKYEED